MIKSLQNQIFISSPFASPDTVDMIPSSAKISSSTSDGIGLPFVQPGTFSLPFAGKQGNVSKGNEKAIADLLSGRRKNSYGVEGMRITGRTDWKRVINVSDEIFADEIVMSIASPRAVLFTFYIGRILAQSAARERNPI